MQASPAHLLLPALIACMLCVRVGYAEEALIPDDTWLDSLEQDIFDTDPGSEYGRNYFSLSVGGDNQNNRQWSGLLQLATGEDYLFDLAAGQNRINDIDPSYTTSSYQLGFGSDRYNSFNWRIGYESWGKSQTIETTDTDVELSYLPDKRWQFAVRYERGDVTLYIDPLFSDRLSSVSSKRDAFGLNIGYGSGGSRWYLSYLDRDYDRDLSAINTSAALQLILKSIALDQVYALSSKEYLLAYDHLFDDYTLGIEFSRVNSVVDNTDSDFVSLVTRYYLDDTYSIKASLHDSLDSSHLSASIGIGIAW